MKHLSPPLPAGRRQRANGWTHDRCSTFVVTLAASGSVTFAAASAGISRKSAYALKKRDAAFAAFWARSPVAAQLARRKARRMAAKGNKACTSPDPRQPINFINRLNADMIVRDGFFTSLRAGLPVAFSRSRICRPLAKNRKQSDAVRLESAGRSTCDSAPPPTPEEGESHARSNQRHEVNRAGRTGRRGQD
jgi:hypothetical protein